MVSRDYTKEVGLHSTRGMVPMPVAIVILAALAVSVGVGIVRMSEYRHVNATVAVEPVSVQVFVRN